MKLGHVRLSGFRGFRDETRIDLPSGFAVVVGANGSGKSTVCDAIEFALTGSVRGGTAHKEKGETIDDYVWWRGSDRSASPFVEISISREDGSNVLLRRTPGGLDITPTTSLLDLLVMSPTTLDSPLAQLCNTTILRDEEITQVSVDLKETERFDFVRRALGAADFGTAAARLHRIEGILEKELEAAKRSYELERDRSSQLSARVSQARVEASRAANVTEAQERVQRFAAKYLLTESGDLVRRGESALIAARARAATLADMFERLRELSEIRKQFNPDERRAAIAEMSAQLSNAEAERDALKDRASQVDRELQGILRDTSLLFSLAQLREHGERVGLRDEMCPLCGSQQTAESFQQHLERLRTEVDSKNVHAVRLSTEHATLLLELNQRDATIRVLRDKLVTLQLHDATWNDKYQALMSHLRFMTDIGSDAPDAALEEVGVLIERERVQNRDAEAALEVLKASQAATVLANIEGELAVVQERMTEAERRLGRVGSAQSKVREGGHVVARLQGELIDQQLAALSPLLVELYERLRPHIDWQNVSYHLRGDVRRMLRVEVGNGMNPSFLFSSGQRRAAGLAFLLAIHLSRRWCRLKTLVLDDPVQHVDDYRALHLTEVLAAVRRTGRQVICTVEDRALADLLVRRLRSEQVGDGVLVELQYESRKGSRVAATRHIRPLVRDVLVKAS